MSRLKLSMVSYLNSKPFLYGMELAGLFDQFEIHLEVPSRTAEHFKNNQVDLALVPVATISKLTHFELLTDYCIGAKQRVDSVFLMSQVPIRQIHRIYLDADSRTSANLLQILMRDYWNKEVEFIPNFSVTEDLVSGDSACLMIGDKALLAVNQFPYQYDLATSWYEFSKLPFVFATWVGNTKAKAWEAKLNNAFQLGIDHIDDLVPLYAKQFPHTDIAHYYHSSIDYHFNSEKGRAMDLFFRLMKNNVALTNL